MASKDAKYQRALTFGGAKTTKTAAMLQVKFYLEDGNTGFRLPIFFGDTTKNITMRIGNGTIWCNKDTASTVTLVENTWYTLTALADYASNTVYFYLDGIYFSQYTDADMISQDSQIFAMNLNRNAGDGVCEIRFDEVLVYDVTLAGNEEETTPENYTGIYWTEEDGAKIGYYYVDGKVQRGAGLVKIDDYLYYVLSTGKISTGTNRTLKESQTNGLIEPGTYYFLNSGVLETEEVRLSGEIRWREEDGKTIGEYYVMDEIRKDVGLVEIYNEEAGEECWYYVLYSGKVKKNYVADGKRVNHTIAIDKVNKYAGGAGLYSFYEDGVMYDPYATETGIVKYDANGKPWYYVDGHIRKDAGLVYVTRGDLAGNYIFVTYSGTLKKGTQTVKESKCNGHTEYVGTQKFDETTGAMIIK